MRYRGHSSVQKRHWSQAARPILSTCAGVAECRRASGMRGREDHDPARGLRDRLVEGAGGPGHHDPAQQDGDVGLGRPAGRRDHLADRRAHRDAERHRLLHGAGHGQELVGDRPAEADVDERLDVHDQGAHVAGKAAGRDHPPGDVVHEDELVARRVGVREGKRPHSRGQGRLQRPDHVLVLVLDPDDALARADAVHRHLEAGEHRRGLVPEQLLVLVQQRLALGAVHDDERDRRLQLHLGREAAAARSHHAALFDGQPHRALSPRPGAILAESAAGLQVLSISVTSSSPPRFGSDESASVPLLRRTR